MASPPTLARYRREVEEYLRAVLDRPGPPLLYAMAEYHLGWRDEKGRPSNATGKRLRPTFCLLACEAAGGAWRTAVPAGAAIELVHSFSLIHDDIQDRDRERHHRPTVWAVWGEAQAINAGDALLTLARIALNGLADRGLPADSINRAALALDEATLDMVEGQTLDIEFQARPDVSFAEYEDMVARKSGALFGCAMELGAVAAGVPPDICDKFRRLGRTLGTAFQFRDDILGIWGDPARTGKPVGGDIAQKKKSLPFVIASAAAPEATLTDLRSAYERADSSAGLALFDELGVQRLCEERISEKKAEAFALIEGLELGSDRKEELREAASLLLNREF